MFASLQNEQLVLGDRTLSWVGSVGEDLGGVGRGE